MKTLRSLLIISLIIASSSWLVVTQQGMRCILATVDLFTPGKVSYSKAQGSLIANKINLHKLVVNHEGKELYIEKMVIEWRKGLITASNILGWSNFIPDLDMLNIDPRSTLDTVTLSVNLFRNHEDLKLTAVGDWFQEPLHAELELSHYPDIWKINQFNLSMANNILQLNQEQDQYIWLLDMPRPNLLLNLDVTSIQSHASIIHNKGKWSSNNLQVKVDETEITGSIAIQDNTITIATADDWYFAEASVNLSNNKLSGRAEAHTENLDLIMKYIPELTRFKGKLNASAKLSGTIDDPKLITDTHVTNITATFPELGVKIKPMELHLSSTKDYKFNIIGKGVMRRGPGTFTIKGYIEPFKDNMPNELNLISTGVEFINNTDAHLIASNKLKFVYNQEKMQLDVTGDIEIQSGHINFSNDNTTTTKSKDVVFVNEATAAHRKTIRFNPSVYLRIIEGVRFKGLGMDANISGKLDINQRHDTAYATGRITIKEGTYSLPGQDFYIKKGRLLYPPGTLLANPVLDIKMHPSDRDNDLEIQVQGTVLKPVISEIGLAANQDKALSQAMLTGSGVISKNLLHDKLKLTELGLTSKEEHNVTFFDNPANAKSDIKDKDFVVGRTLGKKIRTQYLHSMNDTKKRVKLKYAITDKWEIGVEGGNQGAGADLSFVIERD